MTTSTTDYEKKLVGRLTGKSEIRSLVEDVVNTTQVIDVHTHLFAPEFGTLNLSGIDELLTYHYLIAEVFRSSKVKPEGFWRMTKREQADLVWKSLFVDNTPLSEATRGIVTALNELGLDPNAPDLTEAREFFESQDVRDHLDRVFRLGCVSQVVMTNDPFDTREMPVWSSSARFDQRFRAALRMDRLLNDWQNTSDKLVELGYKVSRNFEGDTIGEVRKFLDKSIARMSPLYMAVSLPDTFLYPDTDSRQRVISEIVLPIARQYNLPFAIMGGVRRGVNSALREAGDGVGRADMKAIERLCDENPDVRFMVTMLSRENQHELCVSSRKFSNLMPFGCWWFLNNPSIASEITTERLEMLGPGFIPQHSDARVLEQLIYKWKHARRVIADSLAGTYERVMESGRLVSHADVVRDVRRLFSGNFLEWIGEGE
jgi:hypothetical protein